MQIYSLYAHSDRRLAAVNTQFRRYLFKEIVWTDRLVGIKGARGTGKTTLILQRLKDLGLSSEKAVYMTLDDLHFSAHTLTETIDTLYKLGARYIVLDEVHKYPGWAREVKVIYDSYPSLNLVFTGSSVTDIAKEEAELGRRAALYDLQGLSYREFLELKHGIQVSPIQLSDILEMDSRSLRERLPPDFRPLQYFAEYLESGYYPFFVEAAETYHRRLSQMTRFVVEYDMAEMPEFDIRNAKKLLQLITIIAAQVPFKPNYAHLSEQTGIHRNSLTNYMHYLERARIANLLYPKKYSTASLKKPEKVFLENTNLMFALAPFLPQTGALRETFAYNQLFHSHTVSAPTKGDLEVDGKWIIEIGGPGKGRRQIQSEAQGIVIADGIEYPEPGKVPLWMLGVMY